MLSIQIMKKISLVVSILLLTFINTLAQGIDDMTLDGRFAAQVKSFDEFLGRFNGTESKPGIENDDKWRDNNLVSLLDAKMPRGNDADAFKASVMSFIDAIKGCKTPLLVTDDRIFAKAECTVRFQGKERKIVLILQCQKFKTDAKRWAFVGADGLQKAGMIDTTKIRAISPVDHEIHFMGLTSTFKYNSTEIVGYRGAKTHIDQLSMFLAFAQLKAIEFISVDKLTYHILSVPEYVFTVNEISREDYNSGWLIDSFRRIEEKDKTEYINQLLGRK